MASPFSQGLINRNQSLDNSSWGFFRIKHVTYLHSPILWKVRWICVNDQWMTIYRNEVESRLLARIHLTRMTKVEPVLDPVDSESYCFTVSDNRGGKILFAMKDTLSLENWMMIVINASQGIFRPSENFFMGENITETLSLSPDDILDMDKQPTRSHSFAEMRGYFEKEGHIVKSWKRRYFVLDLSSLRYYDDNIDTSPSPASPEATRPSLASMTSPSSTTTSDTASSSVIGNIARVVSSTGSTIRNSIRSSVQRMSVRSQPKKLKLKGTMHINQHTKLAVFPENYAKRRYVLAIISQRHLVGSVESVTAGRRHSTGDLGFSEPLHQRDSEAPSDDDFDSSFNMGQTLDNFPEGSDEDASDEENDRIIDGKNSPDSKGGFTTSNTEKKFSLRISFPDEATMLVWKRAIQEIINQHSILLTSSALQRQQSYAKPTVDSLTYGGTNVGANSNVEEGTSIVSALDEDYFDDAFSETED